MSTRNRIGNKWTVNEVLSLQREFELLGWDIDQIAEKHGRTANAIMYKIDQEGFADYDVLYSNYHKLNSKMSISRTDKYIALEPALSDDDDTVVDDENDEDYVDDGEEDDDEDNPWDEDEDEYDEDPLTERVAKLETGLDEIKHMLKMLTSSVHGLSQVTYGSHRFNQTKYGSNGVPIGVDF
jgi:hypothetical protein